MSDLVVVVVGVWVLVCCWRLVSIMVRCATRRSRRLLGGQRPSMGTANWHVVFGPVFGFRRLCRSCWRRPATQRGHLVAWSDGGSDNASNMIPQCALCNQRQGGRTPWWAWVRLAVPWWGWRFPVPVPLLVGVAILLITLLLRL